MSDRIDTVKTSYRAFETADRELQETLLADDLTFHAPPDPHLSKQDYWERCWNVGAGRGTRFKTFVRAFEQGDEVFITYEAEREDGSRFRNTEVFTFAGDKIARIEVYFGWDL